MQNSYYVYHSRNSLASNPLTRACGSSYDFDLVAIVIATSPAEVLALMNQSDSSWATNPAFVWCKSSRLRSTSIGDAIVHQFFKHAWLVLGKGFQEISCIFDVKKNSIIISCEKRDKYYVLWFTPKSHAEPCWNAISRSGRWSGVWDIAKGCISFPIDLVDDTWLREIAEQYVDGKRRFEFSDDNDDY